jgi:hypothetical protein
MLELAKPSKMTLRPTLVLYVYIQSRFCSKGFVKLHNHFDPGTGCRLDEKGSISGKKQDTYLFL